MKRFSPTLLATFALSLAVWAFFYIRMPEAPLRVGGTSVVVGVCATVVWFSKWMWTRLRK